MNNAQREERRLKHERREDPLPDTNRAHRDCERECLDQKGRIKALESLLARACEKLLNVQVSYTEAKEILVITDEIAAILPAAEGKKYE